MTAPRDPDRIVRAWLDLMPDEAPDRVVAAVLQAVEATPQTRRPLDRALRRFPTMNRLFVLAAAAVAIVLVTTGVLVVGGPTPTPTPTPTSSSPSPSASAPTPEDLPSNLIGTWLGSRNPILGSAREGAAMRLGRSSIGLFGSNTQRLPALTAVASMAGGDLRLAATKPSGGCTLGDVGTYPVTISPSGQTLTIGAGTDPCVNRRASIPGTWWLSDCIRPGDTCLGMLDPGSYGSQYFTTFVAKGVAWGPVYGAVTFTVPDGWANDMDFPSSFGLSPAADYRATTAQSPDPANGIIVLANALPESQATPCSGSPDPAVKPGASAFIAWLRTLPDLEVGPTTPVTIAGHGALSVDVSMPTTPAAPCNGSEPVVEYLYSAGWSASPTTWYAEGIMQGARERLILLDQASGDLTAIVLQVNDASRFDAFAASAMPIVELFRFPVSFPGS